MFKNNFVKLCNKKGVSPSSVCTSIGITPSSYTKWTDESIPRKATLMRIADYFGVTVDELLSDDPAPKMPKNIIPVDRIVTFREIGTIAAGYDGNVDNEYTGRDVEIPLSMLHGVSKDEFFVLRIKGSSMYPQLVDGDSILVRKCETVESGSIAVILYNGDEATVKKVIYKYGENWLDLVPTNPEYQTKRISGPDLEQCRVLGKVVSLVRLF